MVNSKNKQPTHIEIDKHTYSHNHKSILFINQASHSHIGLGHTTLVPNKVDYSLIINIYIIKLHNKALDIRKRESRDEECSISALLLFLEL